MAGVPGGQGGSRARTPEGKTWPWEAPSFPWRRKQQAAVGKPGFVGKQGGTVKQRTQQNVKVWGSEDQKGGELHEQAFVTYPAKSAQGPSSPLDKEKKEIMTL